MNLLLSGLSDGTPNSTASMIDDDQCLIGSSVLENPLSIPTRVLSCDVDIDRCKMVPNGYYTLLIIESREMTLYYFRESP